MTSKVVGGTLKLHFGFMVYILYIKMVFSEESGGHSPCPLYGVFPGLRVF